MNIIITVIILIVIILVLINWRFITVFFKEFYRLKKVGFVAHEDNLNLERTIEKVMEISADWIYNCIMIQNKEIKGLVLEMQLVNKPEIVLWTHLIYSVKNQKLKEEVEAFIGSFEPGSWLKEEHNEDNTICLTTALVFEKKHIKAMIKDVFEEIAELKKDNNVYYIDCLKKKVEKLRKAEK